MSSFSTDFAVEMRGHFARFGDSITYTPAGGSPATVTALVDAERVEERDAHDGTKLAAVRRVTILLDDTDPDYGGVAAPAVNAALAVNSVSYAVESVVARDDVAATLQAVRWLSAEKASEHYRGPRGR